VKTIDERLNTLGKTIWDRVVRIEAYHLTGQHGSSIVAADCQRLIKVEERALWADLQTLFRGGVFPGDVELGGEPTLSLRHDFNRPPNTGGFHEIVLDEELEGEVFRGTLVKVIDESDETLHHNGRVRCLVAVVDIIEEQS
jgi:hypothetical protein